MAPDNGATYIGSSHDFEKRRACHLSKFTNHCSSNGAKYNENLYRKMRGISEDVKDWAIFKLQTYDNDISRIDLERAERLFYTSLGNCSLNRVRPAATLVDDMGVDLEKQSYYAKNSEKLRADRRARYVHLLAPKEDRDAIKEQIRIDKAESKELKRAAKSFK